MSKGTPRRSVRIGGLWDEARDLAEARGDNLSDIIRKSLENYVRDSKGEADE